MRRLDKILDGQTDVAEMLQSAACHYHWTEAARHLAKLHAEGQWSLADITAATGLSLDTVSALLSDFEYVPKVGQ